MKHIRIRTYFVVLGLLWLTGLASVRAAITVVNAAGASHVPSSICPAIDGANKLNPDPPTYLAPPVAGDAVLTELAGGDSPFAGWTFQGGAALSGTLTINYYISEFEDVHYSGADIKATYVPGVGDPARLRWLQMVETTVPKTGATSPYIDPYPNDDPTNAPLPFYWTEKETKKYGLTFYDASRRSHPPTSYVEWRGHLYLSSWDGNTPGTVTVHDGVKWGFDAGCVDTNVVVIARLTPTLPNAADLSWSTNSDSLPSIPQINLNLDDPLGWAVLTNDVILSNGTFHASIVTPDPKQFFRISLINTNPPETAQPAYLRVQPLSEIVTQGWEASLSVKADGDEPILYQWYTGDFPIPGGTNREYSIAHIQFSQAGPYSVTVSNSAGGQRSVEANLTVVPDTNAPTLVSAVASPSLAQIVLTLSEPVSPDSVSNPGSYQLQRIAPPGTAQIMNAAPGSDPTKVVLTPQPFTPLTPASTYQLRVLNGVCDFATPPNCVAPNSTVTFTTPP